METNYIELLSQIAHLATKANRNPESIKLIAVVKSFLMDDIHKMYRQGCRHFAENRTETYSEKKDSLPADCQWHFIGNLQSKKVNRFLPLAGLIHSVHHPDLAKKVNDHCQKFHHVQRVLLQVNTSGEQTKQGLSPSDWKNYLHELRRMPFLQIEGLMTMAPLTEDKAIIRNCFRELSFLLDEWRPYMREPERFIELSMGMSQDYPIAIEEGATYLRIGSALRN